MTPEARAREKIDHKLVQAGWLVQDVKQLDLGAAVGIAVREYPTDTGPADYVLFVNREAVGVIEAKRDEEGANITAHEAQTERYASATLKWRKDTAPLPFLFEGTGQIIRFTDGRDPVPRAREIFHFFRPETLAQWLAQPNTLRRRLKDDMPALPGAKLRGCQVNAVSGLETSLALNKPRALVHMATGADKTFTAITSVYRLLKFGGAKRILFLVDTRNLGKQAHQEFMAYSPPDDGRKFTELYNVQRLASSAIDPHAQVVISTIQRMYSVLSSEPIDESAEYSYEQSVVDGVNVGYDVYEIDTKITKAGETLKAKEWVDHRARQTRKKRWQETEEDTPYTGKELDRSVVNPSQIRQVIQAMKTAVETRIFPRRAETPKTLIFAKTDSHADDIIHMVREVYGQGNAFCKKVTYKAEEDTDTILSNFRNELNPRIAVTVDMIATGTDGKPLEVLLFMRDVRSRGYYEQMKGRGVRSLDADSLRRVSNSAVGAKERFVLIDAVGVEKSCKTESRPLEKKPGIALKDLLQGVAIGHRDDDTVLSLANRLVRLAKQLDDKALKRIEKASGGPTVGELGKALVGALDPDQIVRQALATAQAQGITRSEDTLTADEIAAARASRVAAACQPFDAPGLREEIETARRDREQLIDHINLDQVTFSGYSAQTGEAAHKVIQTFADFIAGNKTEIEALSFFYQQPYARRALTFDMIDDLHQRLGRPPLMLTTEKLWSAYARVKASQVRGAGAKRQLTDLVALVRFAIGLQGEGAETCELSPFADQVNLRFQAWIFRHNAQRATAFTPEQTDWLRLMKDRIAASGCIARSDFDYGELAAEGGLQKVWGVFGSPLDGLMGEMNEALVA